MNNYSILIQYDNIDEIYVASVPELQGCMAHGKTQEEAICELRIALDMWLKTAKEIGKEIPAPALYSIPTVA